MTSKVFGKFASSMDQCETTPCWAEPACRNLWNTLRQCVVDGRTWFPRSKLKFLNKSNVELCLVRNALWVHTNKVILANIFRDGFALESLTLIPCFHCAEVTTKIQCLQLFSRKTLEKGISIYSQYLLHVCKEMSLLLYSEVSLLEVAKVKKVIFSYHKITFS